MLDKVNERERRRERKSMREGVMKERIVHVVFVFVLVLIL